MSSAAPDTPSGKPVAKLIWRFEHFTLDERGLVLARDGSQIECQDKPLKVLAYLLEHAGEVVTKDELLEHAWPGRIPSESVLTKAMAKLREVLADDRQEMIRTVYGYGYRFSAPVQRSSVDGGSERNRMLKPGDTPPQRPHWPLVQALGGSGETWLAQHAKTGERRIYKFGNDGDALRSLKREITLFRVLEESPGARGAYRRLLDWNLFELPYFLEAEYIAGGSLPQWLEAHGGWSMPLDQRISLIAQVARALDAAHRAGVLHKDLKPQNVLVEAGAGGAAQIRLADFGSGGLVDRNRLATLGVTQLGFTQTIGLTESVEGTLLYAAPEVIGGEMPGMQSDIYSLGVMLYQMSVGDWRRTPAPGWEREIADELLREDIASCTDHAPASRMASAGLVAERLETLAARRNARVEERIVRAEAERLRQIEARDRVRRPWMMLAVGALSIGIAGTSLFAWTAVQARKKADQEAGMQRAVKQFLADLLASGDPFSDKGSDLDVSVRTVIDRAAAGAGDSLRGQPAQEAAIRQMLADIYVNADEFKTAREQAELGLARARTLGALGQEQVNDLELSLINSYFTEYDEASVRKAVAHFRTLPGRTPKQELLADFFDAATHDPADVGWRHSAERLDALLPRFAALYPGDDEHHLSFLYEYSQAAFYSGDLAKAIVAMRENQALSHKLKASHPLTSSSDIMLGDALVRAGQLREGLPLLQKGLKDLSGMVRDDGLPVMLAQSYLGNAYRQSGNYAAARPLLERSATRLRELLPEDAFIANEAATDLAAFYLDTGDNARAIELAERTHAESLKSYGSASMYSWNTLLTLAEILNQSGKRERAIALLRPAHAETLKLLGDNHWLTGIFAAELAAALGPGAESSALLKAALPPVQAQRLPQDPLRLRVEMLAAKK